MIDKNGRQIVVGATASFDIWEGKKGQESRHPVEGVVLALADGSRENQTLGSVTIGNPESKESVTVEAAAVTIIPDEE